MPKSPSPANERKASSDDVIALRQRIGHTQKEAAEFLYVTERTYQNWEYKNMTMPRAIFEYYELKAIAQGLLKG